MSNIELIQGHLMKLFNNSQATKLCTDYFIVSQVWDDLIDGEEVSKSNIHSVFRLALCEIPSNPFYLQFNSYLQPVIDINISKWLVANEYEDRKEQLHKAYMLRAGIYDLFAMCYKLIHGPLIDCSPIYNLYGEIFKEYKKEILCQTQSQQ